MSRAAPFDEPALACLFAGHPRVDGLRALYEWALAMDDLVRLGTTEAHTVAHHKWQWWREELQRLAAGEPRHPLTRRLVAAAPEPGLWNHLPERLELAQFELAGVAPDDTPATERWDWRREGVLQATALQLLSGSPLPPDDPATAFCRALGRTLGRLAAVDAPAYHATRGRLGLPLDALEAAGMPLDRLAVALRSPDHASALASVIEQQLAAARQSLAEAHSLWRSLDTLPAPRPAHMAVRLALAQCRLHRLSQLRYRTPTPCTLPPWRALWVAWTAARQATTRSTPRNPSTR